MAFSKHFRFRLILSGVHFLDDDLLWFDGKKITHTQLNSIKAWINKKKKKKSRKKHPMHYSFLCLHMNVHKSTL